MLKNWYNQFLVTDRYENRLSFWQSLRRRLWSLQFQKQHRAHQIKYSYDFDYGILLQKELDNPDSSIPRDTLLRAKKQVYVQKDESNMETKEQIEAIAYLANTTPEIVKAVLSAHTQVRHTLILTPRNCLHCGEPVRGLENAPEIAVHLPSGMRQCAGLRTFADFAIVED